MIPWNPIHRYSGMTSHFDSLDGFAPGEVATTRSDAPTPAAERPPLGFVDVRAESNGNGAPTEPTVHEPEPLPVGPQVELAVVADSEPVGQPAEEKVPFYKREISLGRKKPTSAPAPAELEPVAEVVAQPEPVAEAQPGEDTAERVPFFKREISFRRGGNEPVAAVSIEPEPEAPAVAPEPEPVSAPTVESEQYAVDPSAGRAPVEHPAAAFEPEEEPAPEPVEAHATSEAVVAEHVESEVAPPSAPVAPAPPLPVPAAEPAVVEPEPVVSDANVPLHKRELSFGKKNGKGAGPAAQKRKSSGRRAGRRIVGLKIGASQLAAAVVESTDDRHELVELARTPLEPGIVLDGEVRDADALVAALRSFFAEQKLPTRDVRIGIASNRIGVRTLEIAGIDDDSRFDNAVRFKAHEVLPIAVSDSVLDYRVLEERRTESGEPARKILLVVAPREQVVPYVEVADRAGLKLAGIDLEALGLLRAFVQPGVPRMAGGTSTVVVAIGHESSTLLVSGGGACEFTRVFDWGGSTLQEAISQELQVHPMEAATILRHLSLTGNARRIEGIDDEARNRAMEAVRLRLTPFARELVSSLQFYQTQPDSLGIGEIVITGGTSQLDGLADALHQMIGVNVRVGNPLERLTLRKGVESGFEQSLGSLAVPIGLAIDDDAMRSVDLTPRDIAKAARSRRRNLTPVLVPVAAAVPLVALGLVFSQAHGKVSHRQSQLSSLQRTYATLPEPTTPQIDANLGATEAARAGAIAQVLGSRTAWDKMLRDLSRVMPQNVWLTDLKASVATPLSTTLVGTTAGTSSSSSTPATATTPQGVTIEGYTYKQNDVATLLARLVALPSLQNVELQSASVAPVGKKNVVQFTILADLRGAGGAS